MNVAELWDEITASDGYGECAHMGENENYVVCVDLPMDDGAGGGVQPIKGLRWDHDEKRVVVEV